MSKKVAVALGGGGAKFFAHLGMLDVLLENKIPINYLSCSSMGAIAGALIANGVDLKDIKKEFYTKKIIMSWFTPSFNRFGFLSQAGINKILDALLPQNKIEDSMIPFSITSANILDGRLHVFTSGDIKTAVCASSAFPGIFPPVKLDGKMLVDGGVLNNIPADLCRKFAGKKGVVISSSLDAGLNCQMSDIRTPFDVYQRIIYLPLYEKRFDVVNKNSDFLLQHFVHKTLNLKSGQDVFKLLNKKDLDAFYELGRETTLKRIKEIKKAVA